MPDTAKDSPTIAALKEQRAGLVASVKRLETLNDGVDRTATIAEENSVIAAIDEKLAAEMPAQPNPS